MAASPAPWYTLRGIQVGGKQEAFCALDTGFRYWRCISKEQFQQAQSLASPHTQKSTKIINLRCLIFLTISNTLIFDYMFFFFFNNKKRNLYLVLPLGLQRSSSELSEGLSPGFYEKVKGLVTQCALLFGPLWTVAHQTPLSMGFSRQDSGVGCHALLQAIFLTHSLNPGLLQHRWFFTV